MKLFWGSIVFIAFASFAPLAFAQQTTATWQTSNGNGLFFVNQDGSYSDATRWSTGAVPDSTTIASIPVYNYSSGSLYFNNNSTLNVAVPAGQAAASLQFSETYDFTGSTQGYINFNLANAATFTVGGGSLTGNQPSLLSYAGVNTTITGGNVNILSGSTTVGEEVLTSTNNDFIIIFPNGTSTLSLSQVALTYGANNSIYVGAVSYLSGDNGVLNQTNSSTVTTGSNFTVDIGTSSIYSQYNNQGNGTYKLSGGSSLTLGANSQINIGTGVLNQDSSSTITLGSGSTINVGYQNGDSATYTTAGVLNLNTSNVNVGTNSSTGILNQTGGTINGGGTLSIGEFFGTGTYNQSVGGLAYFQGLNVGLAGTGVVNQSGTLIITGGQAQIGNFGTGTLNLTGGTDDFQQGLALGGNGGVGTLSQTGASELTSEGASAIAAGSTYTMGGGNAAFYNGIDLEGTLNINSGTFQVGDASLTGTGTLNFGGGTLKFTDDGVTSYQYKFAGTLVSGNSTIDTSSATSMGTFTFQSALTGTGGIGFNGNGTTVFNFASVNNPGVYNSYLGGTSISNGILNAAQNDIVNSSSLTLGSNGTLNLALNASGLAYGGAISGPGTLAIGFSSTPGAVDAFVMPNAGGFTGAVNLAGTTTTGTLQIYNGTFTSISDLTSTGTHTMADVMVGGTPLVTGVKVPTSGTVILPGLNTYTGTTTVSSGFTVKAAQFNGDVVNAGGLSTLGYPFPPTATYLGTPSTLSIAGSLNSTGTLYVFVNGQKSNGSDVYVIGGNGHTSASTVSGVINTVGSGTNQYVILTTGTNTGLLSIGPGGLTTNPALTLFSSTVSIDPTNSELILNTVQKPLGTFATTPAEKAVAGSLDPLTQTPPLSFAPLLTIFNGLPASEIGPALGQLSTQSLQFSRTIAFENSTLLVQRLNGILSDMRSGYAGLDMNGLGVTMPGFDSSLGHSMQSMLASNAPSFHTTAPNGVNYYPDDGSGSSTPSSESEPSATPARMTPSQSASPTSYDGQVMSDSPIPMRTSEPPTLRTSRFSEFVAGDVALADINQNAQQDIPQKVTYTTGDIMAGISFRMTSNLSVGVLFDYGHTNASTDGYGSKTTVNTIEPGVFATFFEKGFYANGLFAFGANQYSNNRNVSFLGGTANSNPTGQQYTANVDLGYDIHPNKQWVVTPTLGLTYTHLNIDSFSETGVPLADLNVNSQSLDSLRSRLGGHVEYMTRVGNVVLQPNVSAMWQHEYLDSNAAITSSFQAYSVAAPFSTPEAAPTTDSALLGCGLTATLDNSLAFYLNYMADVGGSNYLDQSIVLGVKGSF